MGAVVKVALTGLATALALAGCSISAGHPEGSATGNGENSSFTEAGIERILDEGVATIDVRGPLTASDLGADEGSALRDIDERDGDPVEVTVLGDRGDLEVQAEVIRVLVDPGGEGIESIALFEAADDSASLDDRLREVSDVVGADRSATQSFLDSVAAAPDQERDVWLTGGTRLGPAIGLHPVHAPDGASLIEYQVTPPS